MGKKSKKLNKNDDVFNSFDDNDDVDTFDNVLDCDDLFNGPYSMGGYNDGFNMGPSHPFGGGVGFGNGLGINGGMGTRNNLGPENNVGFQPSPIMPPSRLDMLKNRLKMLGITEEDLRKAAKKIKNNSYTDATVVYMKEGKEVKKKERKLLEQINIVKAAKNEPIIVIKETSNEPELITILTKEFKVYECESIDRLQGYVNLKNNEFLRYIREHEIKEVFIAKEKSTFVESLSYQESVGIEKVDEDLKLAKKLFNKFSKDAAVGYTASCYVNGITVETSVSTGRNHFISFEDEIHILNRDLILNSF